MAADTPFLKTVKENRIIVALRGIGQEEVLPAVQALYEGGIRMLEVTFNQSSPQRCRETHDMIALLKKEMGDRMHIGAGTVMSTEEVKAAYDAGAAYILSPNLDFEVAEEAKRLGMGLVPGVMTPTEIAAAYKAGADMVKLFPSGFLGLDYIKAVKAPISHIPILAMGGVNAENLREFLSVVDAVGVGSAIAKTALIREGKFAELTELARTYTSQL